MARPTKLTAEIADQIADNVLHGGTLTDAAGCVGIKYDTFNEWMTRGEREQSGIYFQFFRKVRQSEAQCRLNMTRVIQSAAAKGDWKAAEAYLKRRDRANWGDNVDVTTGGEKIIITIKGIDDIPED